MWRSVKAVKSVGGRQMKVLLRNTETSLYYVGANQWTTDSKQARDLEEVERAIQLHRDEHLTDVEVVLNFDDPLCNCVLPLRTPD
jgi:hypothetical protein